MNTIDPPAGRPNRDARPDPGTERAESDRSEQPKEQDTPVDDVSEATAAKPRDASGGLVT